MLRNFSVLNLIIGPIFLSQFQRVSSIVTFSPLINIKRRDSTDGKAAASLRIPAIPGSNLVDSFSILQGALANNE